MAIYTLHYTLRAPICPWFHVTFSVRVYIHSVANRNTV